MLNLTQFSARFLLSLSALSSSIIAPPTFRLPAESVAFRRAQLASTETKPAEKLSQYTHYDFGPLWARTDNEVVMGFIGPNCQRLRVKILTVRRDTADGTRYYLTGKTHVAGHLGGFSGTLVLRQVRELRQLSPITEAAPAAALQAFRSARREGFILADYELREKPGQPKAGTFQGVV